MNRLLFPNEIERHLHLLWQEEGELLSLIWYGIACMPHVMDTCARYRIYG